MSAISQNKPVAANRVIGEQFGRPSLPGKKLAGKLVRLYPEELARIERAARKSQVSSSRFIVEAALAAAGSPTVA
jgi:hypothetical protein